MTSPTRAGTLPARPLAAAAGTAAGTAGGAATAALLLALGVALALGLALGLGTILVLATPAHAEADRYAPGDELTLAPASAAAGEPVTVRADCASGGGHGRVFSPAFRSSAPLRHRADGVALAHAVVRPGLLPGQRYVVTANCGAAESLTGSLVYAGGSPSGSADARLGSLAERDGGGVGGAALAIGGGLATAGLAGYLLTVRGGAARGSSREGSRESSRDGSRDGSRERARQGSDASRDGRV